MMMKLTYLTTFTLLAAWCTFAPAAESDQSLIRMMTVCQTEQSPLLRLDCYDQAMATRGGANPDFAKMPQKLSSESAQLAINQETQRDKTSTEFIVTKKDGIYPTIVISTIALGVKPPRPILAFSCVDNITRMQLIFSSPLSSKKTDLTLQTEKTTFSSHWFMRDNGYVLETSRGLPGIDEIKRLLNSNELSIKSSNKEVNGLSFSINALNKAIVPLRTECRW